MKIKMVTVKYNKINCVINIDFQGMKMNLMILKLASMGKWNNSTLYKLNKLI